jgi:hypothetical protein
VKGNGVWLIASETADSLVKMSRNEKFLFGHFEFLRVESWYIEK